MKVLLSSPDMTIVKSLRFEPGNMEVKYRNKLPGFGKRSL
ncbi:hypothetical protein ADU37_CDS17720 [Thermococcus sp. 2319x1]|nr:hypothetical protein ADU37_CDS17720 [Thermococcus sp. 2319x1]